MTDREPTVEQGMVILNIYAGVTPVTNFAREADGMQALLECVSAGWVSAGRLTVAGAAQVGKPRKTTMYTVTVLPSEGDS